LPFDGSRRLTGSNLFFASTGAVLETLGVEVDADVAGRVAQSRRTCARVIALAHDDAASIVARRHSVGASLAIAAPLDQLFTATEVNEWALCAALGRCRSGSLELPRRRARRCRPRSGGTVVDVSGVCSCIAGHPRARGIRAVREVVGHRRLAATRRFGD
jgi:hypothetical protein